jgi:hypothetical protein
LHVRLDQRNPFAIAHRGDRKSHGKRAFAASTLLRDQGKDVHVRRFQLSRNGQETRALPGTLADDASKLPQDAIRGKHSASHSSQRFLFDIWLTNIA